MSPLQWCQPVLGQPLVQALRCRIAAQIGSSPPASSSPEIGDRGGEISQTNPSGPRRSLPHGPYVYSSNFPAWRSQLWTPQRPPCRVLHSHLTRSSGFVYPQLCSRRFGSSSKLGHRGPACRVSTLSRQLFFYSKFFDDLLPPSCCFFRLLMFSRFLASRPAPVVNLDFLGSLVLWPYAALDLYWV